MKIYDGNTAGSASETGRAPETHRIEREATSRSSGVKKEGADRVELSSDLGRLSRVLSSFGSSRAARVTELQNQYRSGQYKVDARATSRGMVGEALAGGAE